MSNALNTTSDEIDAILANSLDSVFHHLVRSPGTVHLAFIVDAAARRIRPAGMQSEEISALRARVDYLTESLLAIEEACGEAGDKTAMQIKDRINRIRDLRKSG